MRLELRGVAVASGGLTLLENVSLAVPAGELVALTGPSGSGKTTLLRAISGLDDPVSGHILLHGQTPEQWGWPRFRRHAVLVEQRPVLREMSVEQNLRRPFTYRAAAGVSYPDARARELMEHLGLGTARLSQDARSLSVGQQQRVCLIRALLLQPPLLLLDEPTSALDEEAVSRVEAVIAEEAAVRGLSALIVTHAERQAQTWCHRRFDLAPFRVSVPGAGKAA